jgi:hypothetical protein
MLSNLHRLSMSHKTLSNSYGMLHAWTPIQAIIAPGMLASSEVGQLEAAANLTCSFCFLGNLIQVGSAQPEDCGKAEGQALQERETWLAGRDTWLAGRQDAGVMQGPLAPHVLPSACHSPQ